MGTTNLSDSNICRLCGAESTNAVLIFDAKDEEPLFISINKYLPIQVYDDGRHPRRVCGGCQLSVTATQEFLERILQGQRTIHALLTENSPAGSSVPTAVTESSGPLYRPGNALQGQLKAEGVLLQKRRPGRPRKAGQREPQPPVSDPSPALERQRRQRGKLPARFQNTVISKELQRVLRDADESEEEEDDPASEDYPVPEEDDPPPPGITGMKEDGNYKAPCHIRVKVVSDPGEAAAPATGSGPAEGGIVGQFLPKAEESALLGDRDTAPDSLAPLPPARRRGRPRKQRFQCEVCGKRFLQEGRLKYHRGLHRGVRYECLGCSVRFKQGAELIFHQKETGHTGRGVVEGVDSEAFSVDDSRLGCDHCPRTFGTEAALDNHRAQRHNDDKQFTCTICDKRFGKRSLLTLHQNIHTARPHQPLSCTECGKLCNSQQALAYHTETAHGPPDCRFLCNLCDKSFSSQSLLQRHVRVHTAQRIFDCPKCTMSFKTKAHMQSHLLRHTGERPYECHLCDSSFSHKTSLNIHLRIHSGQKPHECSFCKKRFTQLSNLTEHKRTHTGEKPFPCTVCSRAFTTSCQLKNHIKRLHGAGGRPLQCPDCDGTFTSPARWRAHRRLHKGRAPSLTCGLCLWPFEDAASLEGHRAAAAAAGQCPPPPPPPPPAGDAPGQDLESPLPGTVQSESDVIYVTYQNPADPSTVQMVDGIAALDGGTVQLSADSEVLLEDAAAGVVQLAANKGLVTAEGTRTLEITTEDGRRVQITLQDIKGDLEPAELAAVLSGQTVAAPAPAHVMAAPAETVEAEAAVLAGDSAEVVITASDGRQFRLVTPPGVDPAQFATEYIAGLSSGVTS